MWIAYDGEGLEVLFRLSNHADVSLRSRLPLFGCGKLVFLSMSLLSMARVVYKEALDILQPFLSIESEFRT